MTTGNPAAQSPVPDGGAEENGGQDEGPREVDKNRPTTAGNPVATPVDVPPPAVADGAVVTDAESASITDADVAHAIDEGGDTRTKEGGDQAGRGDSCREGARQDESAPADTLPKTEAKEAGAGSAGTDPISTPAPESGEAVEQSGAPAVPPAEKEAQGPSDSTPTGGQGLAEVVPPVVLEGVLPEVLEVLTSEHAEHAEGTASKRSENEADDGEAEDVLSVRSDLEEPCC